MAYHKDSRLPSVTQVLAPYTDYSRIPPSILEEASIRGTAVHAICAAKLMGFYHPPVPRELAGYIKSFEDWAVVVSDVVLVEPELEDTAHGYCGHLDCAARIRGDQGVTIIDLKTPASAMPTWRPQLAAYRNLAEAPAHRLFQADRRHRWRGGRGGHRARARIALGDGRLLALGFSQPQTARTVCRC